MLKDPVEQTDEYKKAMEEIDPILDEEFAKYRYAMGSCHRYWARKKELLLKRDIAWKSPAEMNPEIRFD